MLIIEGLELLEKLEMERKGFSFAAKTRMILARNLRKAKTLASDYLAVRDKLVVTYGQNGRMAPELPGFEDFQKEHIAALNELVESDLEDIEEKDLNLDENQIPVGVLNRLISIVKSA